MSPRNPKGRTDDTPTKELEDLKNALELVLAAHKGHIVDAVLASAHVYFKSHCLMVMAERDHGHHKGVDLTNIVRARVHDDVKIFLAHFKDELNKPTPPTTTTIN
jgi:hypothetical protein